MTKEELITNLKSYIEELVNQEDDEDWNPYDMYGGNMDDAYAGGERQGIIVGKAIVAEEVLKFLSTLT